MKQDLRVVINYLIASPVLFLSLSVILMKSFSAFFNKRSNFWPFSKFLLTNYLLHPQILANV